MRSIAISRRRSRPTHTFGTGSSRSSRQLASEECRPLHSPRQVWLDLGVLTLLAMGIAVPLGILYFLVRFVKWAWTH
jgi:hypothetical protein